MLILVDQDGVLANFEAGFLEKWQFKYPGRFFVPIIERTTFYQHDNYPSEHHDAMWELYLEVGFFRDLPPIEGAIEGINDLLKAGHDVRICTSPFDKYGNCVLEKYEWVERHLGHKLTQAMILTKDKTLVKGDFLIDDKPKIQGVCIPEWEHIVYDAPYNRQVQARRMTWDTWKDILCKE